MIGRDVQLRILRQVSPYYYNGGLPETLTETKRRKGRSSPSTPAFFIRGTYATFKRERRNLLGTSLVFAIGKFCTNSSWTNALGVGI